MRTRRVAVVGSTGSIGLSTLDVIRRLGSKFKVVALAARHNAARLIEQVKEFKPKTAAIVDSGGMDELKAAFPKGVKLLEGKESLDEIVTDDDVDLVVFALVGAQGLKPLMKAIKAGKDIAFANKEALVAGGELVMRAVKKAGVNFLPIDSEHNALMQCLTGRDINEVHKVYLTASGGPFFSLPREKWRLVTIAEALRHPVWRMGPVISINSATLMNKGLEIIEAHHLFGLASEQIDVVIHPESVIHAMVEFNDGTMVAQMAMPDMHLPIQICLAYPERAESIVAPVDFSTVSKLTFAKVDMVKYSGIPLCYKAIKEHWSYAVRLNAANEELVQAFLKGKMSFPRILEGVSEIMGRRGKRKEKCSVDAIIEEDAKTRQMVTELLTKGDFVAGPLQ
jgi:1-deoxy-D-xylulose-5-phosphate reductoisomerase